jgi:hypothetical protein
MRGQANDSRQRSNCWSKVTLQERLQKRTDSSIASKKRKWRLMSFTSASSSVKYLSKEEVQKHFKASLQHQWMIDLKTCLQELIAAEEAPNGVSFRMNMGGSTVVCYIGYYDAIEVLAHEILRREEGSVHVENRR